MFRTLVLDTSLFRRLLVALAVAFAIGTAGLAAAQPMAARDAKVPVFTNEDLEGPPTEEPEPLPLLEWSEKPGVYENELRRRHQNPLFVESRQEILEADVMEARRRDAERMWQVLEDYISLANDKDRMARYEVASEMGEALLRFDENTWSALRTGGEAFALAAATQRIRSDLLQAWQDVASVDPGVKALLDAEARIPAVKTESSAIRFLALLQAEDPDDEGPLRRYELGAALLSEDVETIREVHSLLRGELRSAVRSQLESVLGEIGREQIEFEGKREKVKAAAELLGRRPADFGVSFGPDVVSELR